METSKNETNNSTCKQMCDTDISREEIVKKFDLPERKTKIETILKLQKEQEQELYCICQSNDCTKFMIGCEKCDEWYHGDCIGLDEKDAQIIKKWYCFDCIEKHGLKVVYFDHGLNKSSKHKKKEKKQKRRERYPYIRSVKSRCGKCSNCLQNEECGNKGYSILSKNHTTYPQYSQEQTFTAASYTAEDHARKLYNENKRRENEERRRFTELEPKICRATECMNLCRVNSKYCSDECGVSVAKSRIMSILPHHVAEQQAIPCIADYMDRAKIEQIRLRKDFIFKELRRLDVKEENLMKLIQRAKNVPIVEFEHELDDDTKMCCVSCGWEVPTRTVLKHMESCFRKFEAQTAYEATHKSNSDYCHIFCDHYNAAKKTFCSRLRFVCPKHYKPRKAGDNEVCGCPVVKPFSLSILSEASNYCQRPKKICSQHYNWEILAISDIDLERHRQWVKLRVLIEEESTIVKQMSDRSGALGILLHSTKVNKQLLS